MDKAEAARQIDRMIRFISEEAKAKAEEIRTKNENEKNAEKLSLLSQLTQQIRQDFEKKKKDLQVQKTIEKSKVLSEVRYATMRHRDNKMNELKAEVLSQLNEVSKKNEYKQLLRYLIAQGILTLQEKDIKVQCRKEDQKLVQGEIDAAIKLFKKTMKDETNVDAEVHVQLDTTNYLPAAPKSGENRPSCTGGVVVSAREGQIICRNTLDHRLELAFDRLKPTVRGALFGIRPPPVVKQAQSSHGHASMTAKYA